MNSKDTSAPTGCYKCGRPGHWSRDCPTTNNNNNNNTNNNNNNSYNNNNSSDNNNKAYFKGKGNGDSKNKEKEKKVVKKRPKLTPELVLSDDGIGFVLKHFPKKFKFHGHGREVSDLGNLLGLYAEWHAHLIPYYSFDQFVNKLEQVGTTKRVKLCLGGLRDRVAHGGDPTKLHDSLVEDNSNNNEDALNLEEPAIVQEDVFNQQHGTNKLEEDMFQEMYDQATEVANPNLEVSNTTELSSSHNASTKESTTEASKAVDNASDIARKKQISDEQKARMEANRLKAMERAAARARSSQVA